MNSSATSTDAPSGPGRVDPPMNNLADPSDLDEFFRSRRVTRSLVARQRLLPRHCFMSSALSGGATSSNDPPSTDSPSGERARPVEDASRKKVLTARMSTGGIPRSAIRTRPRRLLFSESIAEEMQRSRPRPRATRAATPGDATVDLCLSGDDEGEVEEVPGPSGGASGSTLRGAAAAASAEMLARSSRGPPRRAAREASKKQKVDGGHLEKDSEYLEMVKSELRCCICMEPYVDTATINCGHSFCEDCIVVWKSTTMGASAKCPVCRAVIRSQVPNIAMDVFLDKVTDAYMDTQSKMARAELKRDRMAKKEERIAANAAAAANMAAGANAARDRRREITVEVVFVVGGSLV